LALLWRFGEAIFGGGVAVLSVTILLLHLNREPTMDAEQLQSQVVIFVATQ
jgi:hypothetical protein